LIAVVRSDGSVRVWDMATGHDAFTVDAGPAVAPFMSVSWSRDGNLLAVAANDGHTGRATIVDRTGHVVAVRQEEFGVALAGAFFTPDGEHLFTTRLPTNGGQGEIVTWNWHDGAVEQILDVPAQFAFPSPTGDLIATLAPTNSRSDTVELWDPATGQRVTALEGNPGSVLGVAFSPDETRLATGGIDGTVTIWDTASGEQLLVLRGHYAFVASVAFSPDGSQLASVGAEGAVRIWALDLGDLVAIAEREVTRTLTDAECRQYLHLTQCP
jgi:WD40 repeat protein